MSWLEKSAPDAERVGPRRASRKKILEELHRPDREWVRAWAEELGAELLKETTLEVGGLERGNDGESGETQPAAS